MTELNLGASSFTSAAPAAKTKRKPSRVERVTFVFLLSLLFPGLGQVYNRQLKKGLWMAASFPLLLFLAVSNRLPLSFRGFLLFLFVRIFWSLIILADAIYMAWPPIALSTATRPSGWPVYVSALLVIVFAVLSDPYFMPKQFPYPRAFRVPSASMCPTICEQERIVADMHAYRMRNPQRGDLIVLKHEPMSSLLIKRVIGLPGDVVSQTGDTILVNGQALKIAEQSKVCGQPRRETFSASAAIIFEETRITAGAFFVVGDNLPNSFDSRTQAFGVVTQDQMEGRPLFIYWSPGKSRIGCTLR